MKGLDAHGKFLWGLCYRMTGVAADADDLVQETYARALEHPPKDSADAWRTQIALNLARDRLRRRKLEAYVGPWLPSPIEADDPPSAISPDARYEQLESVGLAFLLALEALTPNQRAVLLLRDVFDHSVADTAAALELSEPNVKTTHHRAREAMAAYDQTRQPINAALHEKTRAALDAFFGALVSGDVAELTRLVREDCTELSDGAGQYTASRVPIVGRDRVILFQRRLTEIRGLPSTFEVRTFNGLPGLLVTFAHSRNLEPTRAFLSATIDANGQISSFFNIVADQKLTHVRFG